MRNSKKIAINNKEYTIQELTIKEIKELIAQMTNPSSLLTSESQEPWPLVLTRKIIAFANIPYDDFLMMTPSDIKEIAAVVKEVNSSFLQIPGLLESWGFQPALKTLHQTIIDIIVKVCESIRQATGNESAPQLQENESLQNSSRIIETNQQKEPQQHPVMQTTSA